MADLGKLADHEQSALDGALRLLKNKEVQNGALLRTHSTIMLIYSEPDDEALASKIWNMQSAITAEVIPLLIDSLEWPQAEMPQERQLERFLLQVKLHLWKVIRGEIPEMQDLTGYQENHYKRVMQQDTTWMPERIGALSITAALNKHSNEVALVGMFYRQELIQTNEQRAYHSVALERILCRAKE